MLELKNIVKTYITGDLQQQALKNVSITFRENEFVSILGQSGSGKTTMLNIIGGLDQYTSGDLIINGVSTKQYKSSDWDLYRNKSVGFIFQSYNLIPHQTILANVELALTLTGVSKKERRERAKDVLKKVGLEKHLHKKPNQLSGGQMQRVAIARALINNPDILLADEPTGALDSETSIQIMELLKEIAKEKLVIMVTHNPELAEQYSTRIISLLDGVVQGDTNPYECQQEHLQSKTKKSKVGMSFFTALSLSFNNLKTKKGRTILTAFAGSIGIIGIALILSLSNGMQTYISDVEEDTLSSYPITIQNQGIDLLENREKILDERKNDSDEKHNGNKVYQGGYAGDNLSIQNVQLTDNDLADFKKFIESDKGKGIKDNTNAIQYGYGVDLQIYKMDDSEKFQQINPSPLFSDTQSQRTDALSAVGMSTSDVWTEMIDNTDLLKSQYDVLAGEWADEYNEVMLIVDENNEVSDMTLYALGLKDSAEIEDMQKKIEAGEELSETDYKKASYSFEDILNTEYKLVIGTDYYQKVDGQWVDQRTDEAYMENVVNNAIPLKISGIIRPSKNAVSASISGTIAYTKDLTNYVIEKASDSQIVKEQKENKAINVFTGKEFVDVSGLSNEELMAQLSESQKVSLMALSEAERAAYLESYKESLNVTYEDNLETLNAIEFDEPTSISLYLKDFDSREKVINAIESYNQQQEKNSDDSKVIQYTDMVGIMTSSITSIIDMITYLLIGFVSISLVVSSIMIGIITYISVLERTKEIGILRSIGASKKDISRVFNAETAIIGLTAGLLGIGISALLIIPVNSIIENLSGVSGLASLPINGAVILILISVFLTMTAGLIPAKIASKKDPVIALRSE